MADDDVDPDETRALKPPQAVTALAATPSRPVVLTVQGAMPKEKDFKQRLCVDIDEFSPHAYVLCRGGAHTDRSCVSVPVLLELEWAQREFFEVPKNDISRVLRSTASIDQVTLEDRDALLAAAKTFDQATSVGLRGPRGSHQRRP